MRMWLILGIIAVAFLGSWISWTFYSSGNLETPAYTTVETIGDYEVRSYEPYLVAKVTVTGPYETAINQGFRILADYIFGNNVDQSKIAMTAPVTEQVSTKIAMTAPVTEQQVGDEREITFSLPSKFTLDTVPQPNNDQVELTEIPAKTFVVLRFTGLAPGDKIARQKAAASTFVAALENWTQVSEPMYAAYNDPFSFPFLRRHEILVEVVTQ